MGQHRGIVTPRIVRPVSNVARAVGILLILVALSAAVIGAFSMGREDGIEILKPLSEHMCMAGGECECEALVVQVSDLKQQNIALEQSRQIDRGVNRNLSKQIKAVQDERLALEKEVSFLRRFVQEGGGGILQVQSFKVKTMDTPGKFQYSFVVRQLVQGFGESTGKIEIQVIGTRDGKTTGLPLDLNHKMKFNHFQKVQGSIKVPDGFKPKKLVVEVKPETDKVTHVNETFHWSPE